MRIINELGLDGMSRNELELMVEDFLHRSKLVIRDNGHTLFRYVVANDTMHLMSANPDGSIAYNHFHNYCTADAPLYIMNKDEHAKSIKALQEAIYNPSFPKEGTTNFTFLDGKRIVCEYSCVFDNSGEVRSIVGQFIHYELTPDGIQDTINMLNEQTSVLSAIKYGYESIILCHLTSDKFKIILATDAVKKAANMAHSITELVEMYGKYMVDKEYYDRYKDFLDTSTLAERLMGQKSISLDYLTNNIGMCHARIVPTEMNSRGDVIQAIFTTECSDFNSQQLTYLKVAAEHDGLTGLLNRVTGEKTINDLLTKGIRGVFALFDCDRFKTLNDKLGHPTGDYVLIEISKALEESFPGDVIMRLGGDEFVIFVTNDDKVKLYNSGKEGKMQFFELLQDKLNAIDIPQSCMKVTLSGGALFADTKKYTMFDDVYPIADKLLYMAKKFRNGTIENE